MGTTRRTPSPTVTHAPLTDTAARLSKRDEDADDYADGPVMIAIDEHQVPPEAKPVKGHVDCPKSERTDIVLTGKLGPFVLPASKEPGEDATCLLARMKFRIQAPK